MCRTDSDSDHNFHESWSKNCVSKQIWSEHSRVTFELYEKEGEDRFDYMGSDSLAIPIMLSNNDSGKKIHFPMRNSRIMAQINAAIEWSPLTEWPSS